MAGKWLARAGFLLVLAGSLTALGWYGNKAGYFEPHAEPVLTATATRGELAITVTERGELESSQSLQVNCEIEGGGKLVTISPEGTRVKKGDEVARFDTDALAKAINIQEVKRGQADGKIKTAQSELEVQKNKAESEIAKAKLALTLAEIDSESYEKGEYTVELNKRKGAENTAKKDLAEAKDLLEFNRGLVKKGLAQPQQLRALDLRVQAIEQIVNQHKADVEVLENYTYKRKITEFRAKAEDAVRELVRTTKSQEAATAKAANELAAAEKTLEIEENESKRLKAQLDKCIVKAPGDGIVIFMNQRFFDPNSRVRPGAQLFFQQPIFTLPDLDRMQVKLKIHESVVKKVQKDMPVTMQVEALSSKQVLHGKVLSVASVAQDDWRGSGVKEYQTEVSVDDLPLNAGLRPGMTAEVKILIKTIPDALTIPVQSVTESDGQHVCYVVTGNTVERRVVEIGESNEQLTEVKSGLRDGDRVALDARLRAAGELKKGDLKKADPAKDGDKKSPDPSPAGQEAAKEAVAAVSK